MTNKYINCTIDNYDYFFKLNSSSIINTIFKDLKMNLEKYLFDFVISRLIKFILYIQY